MKKMLKLCVIFLLHAFFLVLGASFMLLYPFKLSDKNVSIEVQRMVAGCGDCYIQTQVIRASDDHGILSSKKPYGHENDSPLRFLGWDIQVTYKGNADALSGYFDKFYDFGDSHPSSSCGFPTFVFKGQLKRSLVTLLIYHGDTYDGTEFDADSVKIIKDPNPACKELPDIPLIPL